MKKGKWNYTEDIEFMVVVVKPKAVAEPKMHWQNAFIGEERQAVEVIHNGRSFFIDNKDGSGLRKIERGGGPDSYHASIEDFEFVKVLPENEWQQWDEKKHDQERWIAQSWQKATYPEEFAKIEALRKSFEETKNNWPGGWPDKKEPNKTANTNCSDEVTAVSVPCASPKSKSLPGRNDRCVCGSGKKFKHCCINKF